jgi:hypothetical protein
MTRKLAFLVVSLLSSSVVTLPVHAQSIWLPRDRPHGILLEILHNRLEYYDTDFPTGSVYLGTRLTLGPTVAIVAEVPYTRAKATGDTFLGEVTFYDGESVGNPYLGVELNPNGSDFFAELGARAPLADYDKADDALEGGTVVGLRADQGRFDAFLDSTVPIHAVFNIRHVTEAGLLTRLRFGPVLTIPTDRNNRDVELYAQFGWQIGYESDKVRVGGAVTGQSILTENSPTFGGRTRSQFEFHADFGRWVVRPGVDIRLPIGRYAETVSVAYGGSVAASF